MNSIQPKSPINVLEFSSQALDDINRLIINEKDQFSFDEKVKVEIVVAITNLGDLFILEGNSNRRYLVSDNCTNQKFELKASSNLDGFAVRKEVLVNDNDPIVRDLTIDRKVKKVVPIGVTLIEECGWICNDRGCIYW